MIRKFILMKLENILWHINVNRKTVGAERILDDVTLSLENMVRELKGE